MGSLILEQVLSGVPHVEHTRQQELQSVQNMNAQHTSKCCRQVLVRERPAPKTSAQAVISLEGLALADQLSQSNSCLSSIQNSHVTAL